MHTFSLIPSLHNIHRNPGVIKDLLKEKLFDAVITTCGTLDHDLARLWKDYYHGDFALDDRMLHKKGVNRLGNILIPNECYGEILEQKLQPMIKELYDEKKNGPDMNSSGK